MRPGIGGERLETMREAMAVLSLKGVIAGVRLFLIKSNSPGNSGLSAK